MKINIISKYSMKRGSFCNLVNVNKEKQNNATLKDSARYPFVLSPYFSALHSIMQKLENSL